MRRIMTILACLSMMAVTLPQAAQAEHICGGATITGSGFIQGTGGNDVILGSDGPDTISSGDGNDVICCGFGGGDQIDGSNGNDQIDGGTGSDYVSGGRGNDVIYGLPGDDTLNGGDGNDQLVGEGDVDTCNGGAGNDSAERIRVSASTTQSTKQADQRDRLKIVIDRIAGQAGISIVRRIGARAAAELAALAPATLRYGQPAFRPTSFRQILRLDGRTADTRPSP